MSKQVMEIEILPSGEVKINVKCVAGPSCEQVSAQLEKDLGAVTSKQRTGEYFQDSDSGDGGSGSY